MFFSEVHSGELGLKERTGDSRDNKMIRDSVGLYDGDQMIFSGLGGDDTYYLKTSYTGQKKVVALDGNGNPILDSNGKKTYKTLSRSTQSKDAVNDIDNTGKIIIDGGITLSDKALPKTDSNNVKIEGVWNLSGFDLHKVVSDLVIVKSGADVSNEEVGKVLVKNFSINSHFSMYKTKVNFLAQNYL